MSEIKYKAAPRLSILDHVEKGSTSNKCKANTLFGHWKNKENAEKNQSEKMSVEEESIYLERGMIFIRNYIVVNASNGKIVAPNLCRVVSYYAKQHNKWFVCEEKIIWKEGDTK